MPETRKIIFVEVDEQDHKYFKLACIREGVTIKQAIRNLVRAFGNSERPDRKERE